MKQHRKLYPVFLLCYLALILAIVILHGHSVVTTPYGRFSYDSLNYVDVASNILRGRGIAQSAVGFNEAQFSPDLPIPMPMTSQPPLYPILIALLAVFSIPIPTAALLISVMGMGIIILAGIWLAGQLYGQTAALLAGIGLLTFAPLYYVTDRAWSETLATGLVLTTLGLLVSARQARHLVPTQLLLAGLTAGLAFGTRYAFLPLFLLGPMVLYRPGDRRCTARSIELFLAGAVLILVLVVGRNLLIDGTLTGSARNPSTVGLLANLQDTAKALFSTYLGDPFYWPALSNLLKIQEEPAEETKITLLLVVFGGLLLLLLARRKLIEALFSRQRFVLLAWMAAYLGFLILQRTLFHFDTIRSRLVFPASIILVILLAGLLAKAFPLSPRIVIYPVLLLAGFGLFQAWIDARAPEMSLQEFVDRSIADQPILDWLHKNTSEDDLIIGDDPVDVVFYLQRDSAVSFSPYPYSDYPDYEKLSAFLNHHCQDYRNFYLFVRGQNRTEAEWAAEFGPFIADLAMGRVQDYPNVVLQIPQDGGLIFQLQCQQKTDGAVITAEPVYN